MNNSQTATAQRRRFSRKAVIGFIIGTLIAGGAAYAAYLLRLGVSSQGTTASISASWDSTGTPSVLGAESDASIVPAAPTVTASKLALPNLTLFPGEKVAFAAKAKVNTGGTVSKAYFSGIDFAGVPAGYSVRLLPESCGKTFDTSSGEFVKFVIEAKPTASGSWNLTDAAVLASPAPSSATVPGTVAGVTCSGTNVS